MSNQEYFIIMNDVSSSSEPIYLGGVLDNEPIYCASKYNFPYDTDTIEKFDTIYLNFPRRIELDFDYRNAMGHIVSYELMNVLLEYLSPPKVVKPLIITMDGKVINKQYHYIAFHQGLWLKGNQQDEHFIFYDRKRSIYSIGKYGEIVPTGEIFFTELAMQYDYFLFLDALGTLSQSIVICDSLRKRLAKEKFDGMRLVPLKEAFAQYCKEHNKTLDDFLQKEKTKRKLPN